ncbi:NADH-quinone oxidoreductase subunit NuoE [Devosia sp.]|uniref:NADH-quinone oxidoreductase subunit NuoE n=1 Tax=Devosia sp. TaxID=1871048 RepID=UPI0035B234CC
MSVRRLADASVQPEGFAFSDENLAWARRKIAEYPAGRQQSAVIPLLWRAQEQVGWVTRAAIEYVATMLSMPYIRVLEVATFYTQFLLKPVGRLAHVQVCGTTPCMLRGAEDIRHVCERRINHAPLETNPQGTLSWEEVECAGACVNAPMVMIGNDTYEDLTVESFEALLDKFEAGKGNEVTPGPQIARQYSAAEGGRTTLLDAPTARRTYKPFPPPAAAAPAPAPAAPAAAPASAPPLPAGRSSQDPPTQPGRKRTGSEESAPALRGPAGAPKASTAAAEAERTQASASAGADGTPSKAMRETATGAESPAGKIDGGVAPGKKPVRKLFEAPADAADDLKLISGVGPVLERNMNALGITTWAQVARLTPEQIAAVEGELGFKGRVTRDKWLEQADALATGGVAEYIRRFGKDPR